MATKYVSCKYCGYQDEQSEMNPIDDATQFGDLVNPNTNWYCDDCGSSGEYERINGENLLKCDNCLTIPHKEDLDMGWAVKVAETEGLKDDPFHEGNVLLCNRCYREWKADRFVSADRKLVEEKPMTIDEFSSKVSALSAIARDFRSDEWNEAEKLSGETIDNADNLEWDAVTCYLDELEEHLGNMKKD